MSETTLLIIAILSGGLAGSFTGWLAFRHYRRGEKAYIAQQLGEGRLETLLKVANGLEAYERLASSYRGFEYLVASQLANEAGSAEAMHPSLNSLVATILKLQSFRELKKGWNGYDADPLPGTLIDRALALLNEPRIMYFIPEVFPTARDSIQFEYRRPEGGYLEVEIFKDTFAMYMEDGKGLVEERDNMSREVIISEIEKFHAPGPHRISRVIVQGRS